MPRIQIATTDVRMLPTTYQATIPESYLDEMGHMNVMWYTHLFSQAMGGVFDLVGMQWEHLIENHSGTFALEAHVRYLAEVRVGQSIAIHSRIIGHSERRFYFMHFMINEDRDNVAATFENVGTHVDLKQRRSSPFPPDIRDQLDALLAEHQQLPWMAPVCGMMTT